MTNSSRAYTLASSSLTDLGLRREMKPGHSNNAEAVGIRYDFDTFWYDAFWDRGKIHLICPKLYGIYDPIREGTFYVDGQPARRVRLKKAEFFDTIQLPARACPDVVAFEWNGARVETRVNSALRDCDVFAGCNCAVVLSKNNDLTWIEDFARYHRQVHGLERMLFFDNGSTDYTIEDIEAALNRAGLDGSVVISAPFRFGLATFDQKGKLRFSTEFLQTSLLNIARQRFLGKARAVLQCDIDELVWCDQGSIFDVTVSRLTGFVRLGVEWRYPPSKPDGLARHSDHICAKPDDPLCRAKYCIRPSGPLGFSEWHIHTIGLLKSRGSLIAPVTEGVWHCKAILSSPWREYDGENADDLVPNAKTRAQLQAVTWSENAGAQGKYVPRPRRDCTGA
ncbi:hypothetical protein [Ruegeria sp.]|uniref:hypothetical protein n=1 Tax=Ruegeria sp. TaxID=1879320 RepID=UPI0023275D7C|nr:hypothetical protein [Ruegeria sp.]MDA7964111.1 hypothetical protein [Ruegeria sp.]